MATAETARLLASLELQDKFSKTADAAIRKTGQLEGSFNRIGTIASRGLGTAAANIQRIGAVAAVGAAGILVKSVQEASSLNEQITKSATIFGDSKDVILDWSKTTATSLGLARSEALEGAGNFGNMFKTIGLADDVGAKFSKRLVELGSDMASFNNEDPSEMLVRIRAGLSGEAEPLRRFGVLLSEARVKEEAYTSGIAERGATLTEAQKVQARYSLILKDTAVQQGDFARTSEGVANQQRILAANLKNAGATIGTALLPQVAKLAVRFNKLITENQPAIERFAAQLPAAFDKALAFADRIPWQQIGSGLQMAAEWAGRLFDVFTGLPPEVQTTLIALAGLNKLSGGAISGIVGELGKGLIKGVLGLNAGVVHIKAGVVTGGGGGPSVPVPAGGGGISAFGKVLLIGEALSLLGLVAGTNAEIANNTKTQSTALSSQVDRWLSENKLSTDELKAGLDATKTGIDKLKTDPWAIALNIGGARDALEGLEADQAKIEQKIRDQTLATKVAAAQQRIDDIISRSVMAQGFANLSAAFRSIPPPIVHVNTSVNTTISARTTSDAQWQSDRYASTTTSGGIRAI